VGASKFMTDVYLRAYAEKLEMDVHIPLETLQVIENLQCKVRHLTKELKDRDEKHYMELFTAINSPKRMPYSP